MMIRKRSLWCIVLLICLNGIGRADGPPTWLLERQLRSVYYETDSYGSMPMRISVDELITYGLQPGVWVRISDSEWRYRIGSEPLTENDMAVWYTFITVEDERFKKLYAQEVILSGIQTPYRRLSNREIFDLMMPVALEIRSQRSQQGLVVESVGIKGSH